MKRCLLTVEFRDYWHIGSGRGQGKHLDAVVDKDTEGLPFVPGRMLKGLLRDAMRRLEAWGNTGVASDDADVSTRELFGGEDAGLSTPTRHDTSPGFIFVGDARLPEDLRCWLSQTDQISQRQSLYRQIFSTAINEATGGARENSLRGIEVVIPVTLSAHLEIQGKSPDAVITRIKRALPLIQAVGAHRSRGLGRAHLSLVEVA